MIRLWILSLTPLVFLHLKFHLVFLYNLEADMFHTEELFGIAYEQNVAYAVLNSVHDLSLPATHFTNRMIHSCGGN